MRLFLAALAVAVTTASAAPAQVPDWRQYRDVTNSSFVEADGDRVLQLSIVVKATPAEVWRAFTTGEGYREWATPMASLDLAVDGVIETSYDAKAKVGDPYNIKNRIVAYVPERMLAIRNVQAPAAFPHRDLFSRVSTTITLEDLGQGRTRVQITAVGYGKEPGFDVLYRHFEWGNAYSLNELKTRFEVGPVDWAARAELAQQEADSAIAGGRKTQ